MTSNPIQHFRTTGTSGDSRALSWAFNYFFVVGVYTLWRSTFYNYALTDLHLDPIEIAYIFTLASIPALVAFAIGYIARYISLGSLIGCSLFSFGVGLIILGTTATVCALYSAVVLISAGFTWYLPLINAITIQSSTVDQVNLRLGRLKSLGPLAAIVATYLIWLCDQSAQIKDLLIAAGVMMLAISAVYTWTYTHSSQVTTKTKLQFNIRLWPIYLLNFLAGSRSALFKAYVITQFVTRFDLSTAQLSSILLAGSFSGLIGYRMLGSLSTVYSAKKVLTGLYFLVALLFIGLNYANLTAYIGLFLLDSLLFGTAVMTDGQLKRADREHFLIGNVATGTTFFHLAGCVVPLLLAGIWGVWGQAAILCFGTLIAIVGCVTARYLPSNPDGRPVN